MKISYKYILIILCLLVIIGWALTHYLSSRSWHIPTTFQDSELVGTWANQTDELIETVTLREDKTFTHIFTSTLLIGPAPIVEHGTWSVERRKSGCIYVSLERMRYLHGTIDSIRDPNTKAYTTLWDDCENHNISIEHEMILVVAVADGIVLILPAADREALPKIPLKRLPS